MRDIPYRECGSWSAKFLRTTYMQSSTIILQNKYMFSSVESFQPDLFLKYRFTTNKFINHMIDWQIVNKSPHRPRYIHSYVVRRIKSRCALPLSIFNARVNIILLKLYIDHSVYNVCVWKGKIYYITMASRINYIRGRPLDFRGRGVWHINT